MNTKNIVWTAVATLALGLGCLVAGYQGNDSMALAFGLTAVASATLSVREKR
jgi:hypothetical protein